jgi:hypothetical protein
VSISRLDIEHFQLNAFGSLDIEKFSAPVGSNIDQHRTSRVPAVWPEQANLGSRSKLGELVLKKVGIHTLKESRSGQQVRVSSEGRTGRSLKPLESVVEGLPRAGQRTGL